MQKSLTKDFQWKKEEEDSAALMHKTSLKKNTKNTLKYKWKTGYSNL